MWTDFSSVLSQCTRLTNRRTDGGTDRILIAMYRVWISCSETIKCIKIHEGQFSTQILFLWDGRHLPSLCITPTTLLRNPLRLPYFARGRIMSLYRAWIVLRYSTLHYALRHQSVTITFLESLAHLLFGSFLFFSCDVTFLTAMTDNNIQLVLGLFHCLGLIACFHILLT